MSIYENSIAPLVGSGDALVQVKGKVALVVNVASRCGLTPQYEALQAIHGRFEDKGFS
ncbi:MAG: glutathione peroxidase, partial [Ilumatobacteraceae bacterium]